MIETVRYNQTPHNDTFCPVCNSGIIEEECRFLLHCPKSFQSQGKTSTIKSNKIFNQLSYTELKIKLMNSRNVSVNSHLLKFVSLCK